MICESAGLEAMKERNQGRAAAVGSHFRGGPLKTSAINSLSDPHGRFLHFPSIYSPFRCPCKSSPGFPPSFPQYSFLFPRF